MKKTGSKILFAFSQFIDKFIDICDKNDITLISCSPAEELGFIKKSLFSLINKTAKNVRTYSGFCSDARNKNSRAELNLTANTELSFTKETAEKTAILLNSGGTAGEEKTIELSSFALNSLCYNGLTILNTPCLKNRYMLSALPYFHGFGLAMGLHAIMILGGCSVIMPKFKRSDTINYLKKGRINYMIGVPALYNALLTHKDFNGSKLKKIDVVFVGGDFVPQILIDTFNQRMIENSSDGRMFEGYGLTETVTVACVNTKPENKPRTVGKPLCNIKISAFSTDAAKSVSDENSLDPLTPLPVGKNGELCICGDTLMNGYFQDNAATDSTFFYDKKGVKWVKSGDFGYIDEDGYVVFIQRLKRVIKVSGENVFPSQLEQLTAAIDGVRQACAFAVPDEKKGAVVHLAVESDNDSDAFKQAIFNILVKSVNPPAYPKKIHCVPAFPMTKMNKINYAELERICKGTP